MARHSEFVEHLSEVFRLFGPIQSRRMFGGYGIYHDDVMIGLVADDELYLKVDSASEPHFREAGSRPFEYTKNGATMKMSYWSAPVEVFEDPEAARAWVSRAYEAALRSRARSAKRRT